MYQQGLLTRDSCVLLNTIKIPWGKYEHWITAILDWFKVDIVHVCFYLNKSYYYIIFVQSLLSILLEQHVYSIYGGMIGSVSIKNNESVHSDNTHATMSWVLLPCSVCVWVRHFILSALKCVLQYPQLMQHLGTLGSSFDPIGIEICITIITKNAKFGFVILIYRHWNMHYNIHKKSDIWVRHFILSALKCALQYPQRMQHFGTPGSSFYPIGIEICIMISTKNASHIWENMSFCNWLSVRYNIKDTLPLWPKISNPSKCSDFFSRYTSWYADSYEIKFEMPFHATFRVRSLAKSSLFGARYFLNSLCL